MRNILYICIMLLGIMCFVGCNDCHGNKKLLAQTDSLLQSRPDSALKLLNSIEKDVGFSEAEWMQFVWNCAQARYRMGMSLAEDSLLPEAIHYYRERKDSSRMLDGYLLEASYYKWMKGNTVSSVGALSSYSHTASLPISAFIRLCSESSSVSITALFASVRGSFVVYRLIIYTSQPTAKRASNNRGTPSFSRNSFVWERFAPRITELISRASSFARER